MDNPRRIRALATALGAVGWLACLAAAAPENQVAPDPGRSTPVHRIPLFDRDGEAVTPGAKDAKPFSLKVTCGKCHDYRKIQCGWHFSTADANVPAGRPAQPWILTDLATGTQIPLSFRKWQGSYRPQELGLSSWRFVDAFGRHSPGGDVAERFADDHADPETDRWEATGYLGINCLACHSRSPEQNQEEWAKNVSRGNYLEADTAASGLAYVTGFVNRLPSTFDRMLGEAPDAPHFLPKVVYNPGISNTKGEVFFDVVRRPPNSRCYYCHSNHPTDKQEWQVPEDIHMARGMACTDCHRHGLDHKISRNYEGETGAAKGYTCRGCHLGTSGAAEATLRKGGFAGAPRPLHKGLPSLHLDELSCTTCHCGPQPGAQAQKVQTARAHALGYHSIAYDPNAPPTILEPVFIRQADGKIAPHRVVFPAFFGRMNDGKVTPLLPKAVLEATGTVLATPKDKKPKAPTAEMIAAALKALGGDGGQAVYVGGGKLYTLGADGKPAGAEHPAAGPCSWPLAHDVRPAAQSLGADGACTDCHSSDSAMLFGKVVAAGIADLGDPAVIEMYQLAGEDATFHKLFGLTFIFRPWLKAFGFLASAVVLLLFLAYGLPAVRCLLGHLTGRRAQP